MGKVKRRRSIQRQAIREIKKYQDKGKYATKNLIPKSCFSRLAREFSGNMSWGGYRFREDALTSLQEASEAYVTTVLRNANKIALAEGRLTLQANDMRIAISIAENTPLHLMPKPEKREVEAVDSESDEEAFVMVNEA